jgi:hypothetical protein
MDDPHKPVICAGVNKYPHTVQVGVRKNAVEEGKKLFPGFQILPELSFPISTAGSATVATICIACRLRVIKTYRYPL